MEFDLLVHIEKTDLYIAVADRWLPKFPQSRIVSNMVSNGMVRMFRNPTDDQDGQGHRAATDQKPGKQNNFNTAKSNYVWLPIRFENDMPIIDWYSEWRIEDYKKNNTTLHRIPLREGLSKSMNKIIEKLLNDQGDNYILPLFWQHGEDEATLRKYMKVIHDANIGAVCVESRPHPDFCGPKWWQDMDIILDEARKRSMKVWIMDDSHFPTGYANGALKEAPEVLCRQFVIHKSIRVSGGKQVRINLNRFVKFTREKKSLLNMMINWGKKERVYSPDTLLAVTAIRVNTAEIIDLTEHIENGILVWQVPPGTWKICFQKLSRKGGYRRSYINMLDWKSCRVLIDAVYEPHYQHYANDFGTTIAGFFSDEPELGNGSFFPFGNKLGTDQPLPWSSEV